VIAKLFLAMTIIPLIELLVLIPLGQQIGVWPTIAIVVVTGMIGAFLGKRQGITAWRRIQEDLASGQIPGDSLLDGLLILIACTLLITPGVLTDVFGLGLLTPVFRRVVRRVLRGRFTKMLQKPSLTVIDVAAYGSRATGNPARPTGSPEVIDITPQDDRIW